MGKLTNERLEEAMGELSDIREALQAALEAINCADSCETASDFDANVEEARDHAKEALKLLGDVPRVRR